MVAALVFQLFIALDFLQEDLLDMSLQLFILSCSPSCLVFARWYDTIDLVDFLRVLHPDVLEQLPILIGLIFIKINVALQRFELILVALLTTIFLIVFENFIESGHLLLVHLISNIGHLNFLRRVKIIQIHIFDEPFLGC